MKRQSFFFTNKTFFFTPSPGKTTSVFCYNFYVATCFGMGLPSIKRPRKYHSFLQRYCELKIFVLLSHLTIFRFCCKHLCVCTKMEEIVAFKQHATIFEELDRRLILCFQMLHLLWLVFMVSSSLGMNIWFQCRTIWCNEKV